MLLVPCLSVDPKIYDLTNLTGQEFRRELGQESGQWQSFNKYNVKGYSFNKIQGHSKGKG